MPTRADTIPTARNGLTLRRWGASDCTELVAIADDRAVWRNLTDLFPSPYTRADAESWVVIANAPSDSLHLAIDLDGTCVGGIGVIAGSGERRLTGQFGYWLGRRHWGQGLATAAGRAFVAHVQAHLPFVRLEAPVFAWNPASMHVLDKLGFEREALLRSSVYKDGTLTDAVLYARLLRSGPLPQA